jgi:hypothetical protein
MVKFQLAQTTRTEIISKVNQELLRISALKLRRLERRKTKSKDKKRSMSPSKQVPKRLPLKPSEQRSWVEQGLEASPLIPM